MAMPPDMTPAADTPTSDNLERRLRGLPAPPVPVGLEARLLAGIPSAGPAQRPGKHARWWLAAAGLAAAVVIAGVVLLKGRTMTPPTSQPTELTAMSPVDIRLAVAREAVAAQLVASAEILAQAPGGRAEAMKTFRYTLKEYGDTTAARGIAAWLDKNEGGSL